ncbi:Uncharacterised protein [Mycoplasmopsis edwardii]|uniref:Uncharacterized protein n=1 Tax=Mycoplasmopsis edwardii TaxID=53558 RepID=A0A3B0Q5K0_9BACT|nr:Uncharacterised protein [Mycoplasmopsis edwardii]
MIIVNTIATILKIVHFDLNTKPTINEIASKATNKIGTQI